MLEDAIARFGEPAIGAALGLTLGALFGFVAQRSRFCMRSAVIEFARGVSGERLAIWLLAVGIGMIGVQALMMTGWVGPEAIRQLNGTGSLSGAAIGGVLFGVGMVLSRGCVSRLLVLSAGGNLRALITGLIFVCVALSTMKGLASNGREALTSLASVEGVSNLSLLLKTGIGSIGGVAIGVLVSGLALRIAIKSRLSFKGVALAVTMGVLVAATYAATAALNGASFDPQPVRGLSFIAPSASVLSAVLVQPATKLDFDLGLIPGVFLGALIAAALAGEWKLEGFRDGASMRRYIAGAVLMGFGGVVATGCSMGNGVSGSVIFSTTAVTALVAMWLGATATDYLVDRPASQTAGSEAISVVSVREELQAFKS